MLENVSNVETFLNEAEGGLNWGSSDDDNCRSRECLLEMMRHLAEVRSRQASVDAMFEPLYQVSTFALALLVLVLMMYLIGLTQHCSMRIIVCSYHAITT